LVSIFTRFLAQKRKSVPKQAAFSPTFPHRAFMGHAKYTGMTIPRKAAPAVRFQKISCVLLLAPRVTCPPRPLPPPPPDSSSICDSGVLPGLSSPSPTMLPRRRPLQRSPVCRLLSATPPAHHVPCRPRLLPDLELRCAPWSAVTVPCHAPHSVVCHLRLEGPPHPLPPLSRWFSTPRPIAL
jgi:hypothetical protein